MSADQVETTAPTQPAARAWWRRNPAPETAPAPEPTRPVGPVRGGGRLPDWRTGQTVNLDAAAEPADENEEHKESTSDAPDDSQDHDTEPGDESAEQAPTEPMRGPRIPTGLVNKGKAKANGFIRVAPLQHARENDFLRWLAFNGGAAGIGYYCGLVHQVGRWLPAAEQAATGTLGAVLAAAGVVGGWKLTGHQAVYQILPYAPISRLIVVLGAAELGRRSAPMGVDWLNAHGTSWGLGPSAVSLLLTAGGVCGGLWWFLDRRARTRGWHMGARFAARIPLASALLAAGLYAPGIST